MSELMKTRSNRRDFRWQLLTTVSALALVGAAYRSGDAKAADQDTDRPTVWIELGGQLESISGESENFSPPFIAGITHSDLLSALNVQHAPAHAFGIDGRVSFQPNGSDWVFSASLRYGRSQAIRHKHHQTANAHVYKYPRTFYGYNVGGVTYYPSNNVRFADGTAKLHESHAILDFQAGKDVGLGMFGSHGSSTLNLGVRIAQFMSKASVGLQAEPDLQYPGTPIVSFAGLYAFMNAHVHFHDFAATFDSTRSFRGVGPELSWDASTTLAGDRSDREITFDWGLNGAVLFGRQKVAERHKTVTKSHYVTHFQTTFGGMNGAHPGHFRGPCTAHPFNSPSGTTGACAHHTSSASRNRSRFSVVPNIGAFAGLSFRYSNAKVSFGYRADFFFGAIDEGVDVRRAEDIGFNGPFATISVGLGG